MHNRILYFTSLVIIISAAILMVWFFIQISIPFKPLELFGPFPVKTKIIRRGESIIYTATYIKRITSPCTVSRTLENGLLWALPNTTSTATKTGEDRVVIDIGSVIIPKDIPLNTYTMKIAVTCVVNSQRTFIAEARTEPFIIVDSTDSATLK